MSLRAPSVRSRSRKSARNVCKRERKNSESSYSKNNLILDAFRSETRQLVERSEELIRVITHVCSQQLSGIFRACGNYPQPSVKCCSIHKHAIEDPRANRPDLKLLQRPADRTASSAGDGNVYSKNDRLRENESVENYATAEAPTKCRCGSYQSWELSFGSRGSGAGPPKYSNYRGEYYSLCTSPSLVTKSCISPSLKSAIFTLLVLVVCFAGVAESCSSRSTPKPRPASATLRPNVTFPTYACPPAYAAWFCLNGATCFTVKIQDAILYNCECAEGYRGPRCEFKNLDGTYLPAREKTASIAGGACVAIVLVFFVLFAMYIFLHKDREKRRNYENLYCDKRPLNTPTRSDYICTITPLHVTHSKELIQPNVEIQCPVKLEDSSRDFYLVSGLEPVCLRTCERRDFPLHVTVAHPHRNIIIQNKSRPKNNNNNKYSNFNNYNYNSNINNHVPKYW